jgi:hypothetical protein
VMVRETAFCCPHPALTDPDPVLARELERATGEAVRGVIAGVPDLCPGIHA